MKKFLLLSLMACLLSSTVISGEGDKEKANASMTITGQIIDQKSHEPIVGAKIFIKETNEVIYSDFDGNFELVNISPGIYTILASFLSYNDKVHELDLSMHNEHFVIALGQYQAPVPKVHNGDKTMHQNLMAEE